jgi:hypothetical protein
MPSPPRWTRRASALLAVLAVVGVLHAVVLLALSLGGAPTLALSLLAAVCAAAAGRSARLLRRGALDPVPAWLALWAGSTMAIVGVTGATFRPGAMFWWNAAGATVAWLVGGAWLGRRVVAEARGGRPAVAPPAATRAEATAAALSPDESLQLPEPSGAPAASTIRGRGAAAEISR